MKKEDYTNRQGVCPKCQGYNLDYQPIEFTDTMCYYATSARIVGKRAKSGTTWSSQGTT